MLGFVDKNLTDIYTGIRNLHVTKPPAGKRAQNPAKKMNKVDFKQTTDTKEITVSGRGGKSRHLYPVPHLYR
jgi:hypothetical protein